MDFEHLKMTAADWDAIRVDFPDRTVFQTSAWISFIAETQNAEPVFAVLRERGRSLGYFVGLIVHKFGLRILGSPFPGWTTSYMGFNLREDVRRRDAIEALVRFAFSELHCVHLELLDRQTAVADTPQVGWGQRSYRSYEIDLRPNEEQLLKLMDSRKRRNLHKALRCGLMVEEAEDASFAEDYFSQLRQVFAKQSLVPTYGIERVRALIRHLQHTGMLLLLRARDPDGRCIATNISLGVNRTVHLWGAASWREYQTFRPNELLTWEVMRSWKARGMHTLDFTGGGDYKRRYGAQLIAVPWIWKSKFPFLSRMRNSARQMVRIKQQLMGQFSSWPLHTNAASRHLPEV